MLARRSIPNRSWVFAGLALAVAACGSPEPERPVAAAAHRLQVPEGTALPGGARVLADYGAYRLVEADPAATAALSAEEGVERRDEYFRILLNAGAIDTRRTAAAAATTPGKSLRLIQFAGPIRPEWHDALVASGVRVVSYIPNNAYLVYGDPALFERLAAAPAVQWQGDYLAAHKLQPQLNTVYAEEYWFQLVEDGGANEGTLALIRGEAKEEPRERAVLGYLNVEARVPPEAIAQIAARPDVVTVGPRPPRKLMDERQDIIMVGSLTGAGAPNGPGYLAWLASKGFTQAQFTASGFGVDVTDSGLDNGTSTPNHFGLYVGGSVNAASRVVYARLEGTPNSGSTLQGCDGHGTINGHIIAGYNDKTGFPHTDGSGYHFGLGVAPFVKLGSSVIFDSSTFTNPNYTNLQARAYRDGMRVSGNSWGADNYGGYDADAQEYDALVRDAQPSGATVAAAGNQEMVIVFANGNAGPSAGSVGSPATAKNVFSAGASENVHPFGQADGCDTPDTEANSAHDVASFSSRGPCSDGRKKPDIQAPGTHITGGVAQAAGQRAEPPAAPNGQKISCFAGEGVCGLGGTSYYFPAGQQWWTTSSGTSHSTPAVAGAAALVRQYFINQGWAPPSPAMTKAYLMNSATHMTGVGANDTLPSNNQGMGRLDLGKAFDGVARQIEDQKAANLFTASGQTRTFSGYASDPTKPFVVTLAWTDAPGATSGAAWKNNLDLAVTIGGKTYKGNVFSGARSITGGSADTMNNVETVSLAAGATGAFTVTVTATNINSDGVPNNSTAIDQDFALVIYNVCATAPATPTGVTATASAANRIDVSWVANGATEYNVYRSTVSGGPYTRVATVAAPPWADTTVSGGTRYYYVVRGRECAESPNSAEVSALASGVCQLLPQFAGLVDAESAGLSDCTNTLTWAAATPGCGGTIRYAVYRSTTSGFTPSAANRIATGVAGTSYQDAVDLVSGTTYHYVVRAVETAAATVEEENLVQLSATPFGAVTPGIRYFDDFDGTRPANAAAYLTLSGSNTNLGRVNSGCKYQSPTSAYRLGAATTGCTAQYPTDANVNLVLGGNGSTAGINGFAIPANATAPTMTFSIWYDLEDEYDGVYLAYSIAGATGALTPVPDAPTAGKPYITEGGYDGTLGYGGTQPNWTGTSTEANGALKRVSVNLDALKGKTVWFAFRFTSDDYIGATGFYLDDVRITADAVASCTTSSQPPGPAVGYAISNLPATVAAGAAATFDVRAVDASGRTATGYQGTAAFTSTDAAAVLPANATFVNGVASGRSITFRTPGAQTLTATDTTSSALKGTASTTVSPAPAKALEYQQAPGNAAVGALIPVTVRVLDTLGNLATSSTATVSLALGANPGGATLGGQTSVAAVGGIASFNVSLNQAGAGYTLVATSAGLTPATSAPFTISALPPGPAVGYTIVNLPASVSAGASAPFEVRALDAEGKLATGYAGTAAFTSTDPAAVLPANATFVAGVASGKAVTFKTAGAQTLTATDTSNSTLKGTAGTTVSAGAAKILEFQQAPADAAAGAIISVKVRLLDQFGNPATSSNPTVTLALGANPGGGTLSGVTSAAAASGIASFIVSIDKAGAGYTLVASSTGLTSITSAPFAIAAGSPAKLAFTVNPVETKAGAAIAPALKVAVLDSLGNLTASTAAVALTLASNPGQANLSGTLSVNAVGGIATFSNVVLDKAAAGYRLKASSTGLADALSTFFAITPDVPHHLAFTAQPTTAVAGSAITPAVKVSVFDRFDNLASAATTVALSLAANPSQGTLAGTLSASASGGVAAFANLSLDKVGTGYALSASASGLAAVRSSDFNVLPGAPASLAFQVPPSSAVAGKAITPAVEVAALDAKGNLATGATGNVTVALAANPTGAALGGSLSQAFSGGVARFANLTLDRVGTGYTLQASASGGLSVVSPAFAVSADGPAKLGFTVLPTDGRAGQTFTVAVAIQDAAGNTVPTASGTVALALEANAAGGTLTGTLSQPTASGVATFADLSLDRVGSYTLKATASPFPAAVSAPFAIVPGPAAALVFQAPPANTTAGTVFGPIKVEIRDGKGNLVTGATDTVSLTLGGPAGAVLGGTASAAAQGGVATFANLFINKAGSGYSLVAHAASLPDVASSLFDVLAGSRAALAFLVQPSATQAGVVLAPAIEVAVQDAAGNVLPSAEEVITLSITPSPEPGTLQGTLRATTVAGVATFADLTVARPATGYALKATAVDLPASTSATFDVSLGAPAKLAFLAAPASTVAGAAFAPAVRVALQDSAGNTLTAATASVTLSLGANPAAGELLGTLTRPLVAGVAEFDDLAIRKAGAGYALLASADAVTSAASAPFAVLPAAAATLQVQLPANSNAGEPVSASAAAFDAFGNATPAYDGQVAATSSDPMAELPAPARFVDGVLAGLTVTFNTPGVTTLTLADTATGTPSGSAQTTVAQTGSATVEITRPANGAAVTGKVQVGAYATVNKGTSIRELAILVDGAVLATGAAPALSAEWDTTALPLGSSHTLSARLTDSLGVTATSAPVTVTIKGLEVDVDGGCGCGAAPGAEALALLPALGLLLAVRRRRR